MTPHRRIRDRLRAYWDGELSPDRAEEVRAHVDECAECASELARIDALHAVLASDPDPRPLGSMADAVRERRRRASGGFSWTPLRTPALGLAGLAMGLVIGAIRPAETEAESTNLWTDLGSTYGTQGSSSLSDEYLSQIDESEETTP
jgi:anti-sigma factor RsiW